MKRSILVALLVALALPCGAAEKRALGLARLYYLLDRACASGDELAVEMLLDAGADPSGRAAMLRSITAVISSASNRCGTSSRQPMAATPP